MSSLPRPSLMSRWLVALLLWLGAVLPAMATMVAAERGDLPPWTQLCRSSLVSPRALQGDYPSDPGPQAQDPSLALFACGGLCAAHHPLLDALPLSPALSWQLPELQHERPLLFWQAAKPRHVWQAALSRGPPVTA